MLHLLSFFLLFLSFVSFFFFLFNDSALIETSPALAPLLDVDQFNDAFDAIDTDRDNTLTFLEFVSFLDAFDVEMDKAFDKDIHKIRYERQLNLILQIDQLFVVLDRLGDHPGCGKYLVILI